MGPILGVTVSNLMQISSNFQGFPLFRAWFVWGLVSYCWWLKSGDHHLRFDEIRIKPCNLMGYLPTSTGDVSRISSNHQQYDDMKGGSFHPLVTVLPLDTSILCRSRSFLTAIWGFTTCASKRPGPKLWFFFWLRFGWLKTGWWQLKYFWNFHPDFVGKWSNLTSIFFWWVGSTTN